MLHLRHAIERPDNGWLLEPQLTAAIEVWDVAVAEARTRGLVQPRAEEIPLEAYQTAIASRAKRRPREAPEPPPPAAMFTAEELASLEAAVTALPLLRRLLGQGTP